VALAALLGLYAGGRVGAWSLALPRALERAWAAEGMAGEVHGGVVDEPGGAPGDAPRPRRQQAVARLATALLFAACAWRFGPTPLALCGMGLVAALLTLAWIDFETRLLPDAITLPLAWAGLLVNLQGALTPLHSAVLGAVAGYLFLWSVFHVFRWLTGREGMGYGDFKLAAALGAWFGLVALPWLLVLASTVGALVGLALRWTGRAGRGEPLSFGPYLAGGGILMLLSHANCHF
jgi:leader peptidase (prepilin peptidase)/N-methyltransferase